jgi:hypothetical protein
MARDHDEIREAVNTARHRPRKRTIQYAVTSRFISDRSGILDAPLSRGMTVEY